MQNVCTITLFNRPYYCITYIGIIVNPRVVSSIPGRGCQVLTFVATLVFLLNLIISIKFYIQSSTFFTQPQKLIWGRKWTNRDLLLIEFHNIMNIKCGIADLKTRKCLVWTAWFFQNLVLEIMNYELILLAVSSIFF